MPTDHTVQQGECLSSIAKRYGFADWKSIYDHDLNGDLRTSRPDPNVLFPGDVLSIPDKELKDEACQTTMVHTFKLAGKKVRLRVVVRDIDGKPAAGKKYKLVVEGETHEGVLPDSALIDEPIPADAIKGELTVWIEEEYPEYPDTWTLQLGHLDPVEKLSGVQARLNNLGYDCGPVDGVDGPRTQAAVRAFQKDQALQVDGIPGPETQAALRNGYGC